MLIGKGLLQALNHDFHEIELPFIRSTQDDYRFDFAFISTLTLVDRENCSKLKVLFIASLPELTIDSVQRKAFDCNQLT